MLRVSGGPGRTSGIVVSVAPVILILVVGCAATVLRRIDGRKRQALARQMAARRGFQIDTTQNTEPDLPFSLFSQGHRRRVTFRIWRDGEAACAFQYRYATGAGNLEQVHDFSCVLAPTPFSAPHLRIDPEGMLSTIGRMVGIRDIEVESPEFNALYRVRGDDERFAITLLDQQMIAWMLDRTSGRGVVHLEFSGRWMLASMRQMRFEELFGFHDWASWAIAHTPAVLPSLYPPS